MEMYTKHFCFEFLDFLKYVENEFQIKGANAPGSQNASPASFFLSVLVDTNRDLTNIRGTSVFGVYKCAGTGDECFAL
jgi:hypothetical protein